MSEQGGATQAGGSSRCDLGGSRRRPEGAFAAQAGFWKSATR